MSRHEADRWVNEIVAKTNTHGLVRVHLDPGSQDELVNVHAGDRVKVVRTLDEVVGTIEVDRPICWAGFGAPERTTDAVGFLGDARAAVHELLTRGGRLCILSEQPQIAFPDCRGSSLLADAHLFRLPPGSVGPNVWEAGAEDGERVAVLRSLGAECLAFVDMLVHDLQAWRHLDSSLGGHLEWEALEGAGLIQRQRGERVHPLVSQAVLRAPLEEAIAQTCWPQADLGSAAEHLFAIERLLRHAVRVRAIWKYDKAWRGALFGEDVRNRILERARTDFGPAPTIKSVRDPLEWITLGELFDIVQSEKVDRLEVPEGMWRRMAGDVLPVRNTFGHMRLLRRADLQKTATWLAGMQKIHDRTLQSVERDE